MQHLVLLDDRGDHATQHEAGVVGAIFVLEHVDAVATILTIGTGLAVEHADSGTHADAFAVFVVVQPGRQVIDRRALDGGDPLGADGFFQAERRVDTTNRNLDRLPAVVVDGQLLPIAGIVAKVAVEGVAPIGEGNTGNLQTRTTEVGLICALAVLGVETIEAVGISLQTAIDLERELLVGGSDLQAALGLDNEIGAVGGDGTGESLGGNGQSQSAGSETGEVLTDHPKFPFMFSVGNTRDGLFVLGGILATAYVSQMADM